MVAGVAGCEEPAKIDGPVRGATSQPTVAASRPAGPASNPTTTTTGETIEHSTSGHVDPAVELSSAPDWANGPEDGDALFGVGIVRGIRNVTLARTTASARARADLGMRMKKSGRLVEGEAIRNSEITSIVVADDGSVFARAELAD